MTNKHCDFVSIELAYDLMDNLKIATKGEFARLCGVSHAQFNRWENKGRMPQYRYAMLQQELHKIFKEEYDTKLKLINF